MVKLAVVVEKLGPALKAWERLRRVTAPYSLGLMLWALATLLLALAALMLALKIFFSGHALMRQAIDTGQHVSVHIANGDVEGNPRHTRREEAMQAAEAGTASSPILSKDGLAPAPLASLTEQSDKGLIPVTAHDGTLPWKYYARPYTPVAGRPMVALILTNLGLSKPLTEEVLTLPHNFTLSFSPYAGDAKNWQKKARETGFESLVDLPMEPQDYPLTDPGPYALIDNLAPAESTARLHWVLSRFPGYVGTLAPEDEKLTADTNAIRPTLTELTARGLLFVYVKNAQNGAIADLAKTHNAFPVGADKVIDDEISPGAIDASLADLTALAKKQGYAIGIAHSYPPTLEALARWIPDLQAAGVDLVPVSAIAERQFP